MEKAMKVTILTDHCLGGGRDVFRGDVTDLPDGEAKLKIARGWAKETPESVEESIEDTEVPAEELPGEESEPTVRRGRTRRGR